MKNVFRLIGLFVLLVVVGYGLGAWDIGGVSAANLPPALREDIPAGTYTGISVQSITTAGTTVVYSSTAAGGAQFVNDGRVFIHLKNSGTEKYITVTTPTTIDGLAIEDIYVTVPATTGDKMVGPFPTKYFNYAGGLTKVDFSGVTGLTIAAVKLPQ